MRRQIEDREVTRVGQVGLSRRRSANEEEVVSVTTRSRRGQCLFGGSLQRRWLDPAVLGLDFLSRSCALDAVDHDPIGHRKP
jgi:hypothetical protein